MSQTEFTEDYQTFNKYNFSQMFHKKNVAHKVNAMMNAAVYAMVNVTGNILVNKIVNKIVNGMIGM